MLLNNSKFLIEASEVSEEKAQIKVLGCITTSRQQSSNRQKFLNSRMYQWRNKIETEVVKTGGQVLNSNMKSQARILTTWLTKWQYTYNDNVRTEISIIVTKKTLLKFIQKITSCLRVLCSWHAHCLSTIAP